MKAAMKFAMKFCYDFSVCWRTETSTFWPLICLNADRKKHPSKNTPFIRPYQGAFSTKMTSLRDSRGFWSLQGFRVEPGSVAMQVAWINGMNAVWHSPGRVRRKTEPTGSGCRDDWKQLINLSNCEIYSSRIHLQFFTVPSTFPQQLTADDQERMLLFPMEAIRLPPKSSASDFERL